MNIDVILKRIEELMSAEPGTPEYTELEYLSEVVEIYEDEYLEW